MSEHIQETDYQHLDERWCTCHLIGGYENCPDYKDVLLNRIIKAHNSWVVDIEGDKDLKSDVLEYDYVPPNDAGSWLFTIHYDQLSRSGQNKVVQLSNSSNTNRKVWVFLIKSIKTRNGFPLYQKLQKSSGMIGYWCTYVRGSDIKYLLRDTKGRPTVNKAVNWISQEYNRDPAVLCAIYKNYPEFAHHMENLKDPRRQRDFISKEYGVATTSPRDYLISVMRGKAKFDQGYWLYRSCGNGEKFREELIWELDQLLEAKILSLYKRRYNERYGFWVKEFDLQTLIQERSYLESLNVENASSVMWLTKKGKRFKNEVLQQA